MKRRERTGVRRREENRRVTPAAVDGATQPKLLTLCEKASSQILKAQSERLTGAESKPISRWHTENMERLHTAAQEPVTQHA